MNMSGSSADSHAPTCSSLHAGAGSGIEAMAGASDDGTAAGNDPQAELKRFRLQWQRDLHDQQRRRRQHSPEVRKAESSAPRDALGKSSSRLNELILRSSQSISAAVAVPSEGAADQEDPAVVQLTRMMVNCFSTNVQQYSEAVLKERVHAFDEALELYRKSFRTDANVDHTFQNAAMLLEEPQVQHYLSEHESLRTVAAKVAEATEGLASQARMQPATKSRSLSNTRITQEAAAETAQASTESMEAPPSPEGAANIQHLLTRARALRRKLTETLAHDKEKAEKAARLGNVDAFVQANEDTLCMIAKLPDEVVLLILRHLISMPHGRTTLSRAMGIVHAADTLAQHAERAPDEVQQQPDCVPKIRKKDQSILNDPRRKAISHLMQGMDHTSLELLGRVSWKFRVLSLDPDLWRRLVEHVYKTPQLLPETKPAVWHRQVAPRWREAYIKHPRVRFNGVYIASCQYTRPGVNEENVWIKVIHVIEFYRYFRFLPDGRCLSLRTTDPPTEVVRKIDPSLRVNGFAIGSWQLYPDGLEDDKLFGRPPGPKLQITHLYDETMPSIRFRLILLLRNGGPIGRWNKMDLLEYRSVNLHTGEDEPLLQKHSKPFFFSAVRSFIT
ncbi:hypothetical protein K437DRAFT_274098 [Tilletiaria anomala UBC 951]|uniref:F-box protein Hrt3/FBXO9 C-terminal domain-containing protein n=1 Tax=Tilletiaria anomala (strain ATCC 24038 / CBS 436.72 / UBC 951) TaxID=1037660 RepID=A0A066W564_TILAU|nr:uncharacterized protein K437DRAFT_274098 [Tilletiaria anomala UBC 951]KDN45895.1 hypothetical protein K437DRAFT_274098 [Tilletiaria anomala UBC 951]